MWTLPRADVTLKKICPYLSQAEWGRTLAWVFLQRGIFQTTVYSTKQIGRVQSFHPLSKHKYDG